MKVLRAGDDFPSLKILVSLSLVCSAGCASINPAPFEIYSNSVATARQGLESSMETSVSRSKEHFIKTFGADPESKLTSLFLEFGDGYDWKLKDRPLYLDLGTTLGKLRALNSAFAEYLALLLKLAGKEITDPAQFKEAAIELNANASDMAKTLGLPKDPEPFALISIVASETFRSFIESGRKESLQKAISDNQAIVQKFAERCAGLIHIQRSVIKREYTRTFRELTADWRRLKTTDVSQRQTAVKQALSTNQDFVDTLEMLHQIENMYATLPTAHRELGAGLTGRSNLLGETKRLTEFGQNVQRLFKEIQASKGGS